MANFTCTDCGSRTINRRVDEKALGEVGRHYVEVPYRCSNRGCPNSEPGNQAAGWAIEV